MSFAQAQAGAVSGAPSYVGYGVGSVFAFAIVIYVLLVIILGVGAPRY